ncbi:AraC family transcriptional regulator [Mesorhizobium sp. STM 4661]|uniref:AraC family transcriptional regulator n=1 Tax=Mesorhizobium sp. STM 4661 TaxID=1297570 RepID=UPI0002C0232A|nr:AraC family transcriptional regulator [Mesorhizobium sp. STM 4661]CCV15215.1 putative araC-like transcription regulator [Mesorhizobium sp. STM 4661]
MIDPLSDVLSLLDIASARCTRLEAGGRWSFRFPAKPALKFAAVLRGQCWIKLPGEQPFALSAGDTFLLANAPAHVITNDLSMRPEDGISFFDWKHSNIARYGGDETALIGGSFVFEGGNAQLLLDALPKFMHIPESDRAATILRGSLAVLDEELDAASMGSTLMTRRMGDVLLVQTLRAYVAKQGIDSMGWVGALTDRRVGAALSLMHNDPGHGWTVNELATSIGMSRSGFARRFKELVGVAPLDYLTRWRMHRAREAMRRSGASVGGLAQSLGYASESAFGNAFKRVFGRSPKRLLQSENAE